MLEKNRLSILPWSSSAGLPPADAEGFPWVRRIQDSSTGGILGFAGWVKHGAPLFNWWRGKSIRVFETPDASLLLTLHRPFGPLRRWQAFDAEERRIGSFHGLVLFDGAGDALARLKGNPQFQSGKFVTHSGGELGAWELQENDAGLLTFAESANPFVRMNLLGKILTLPPFPV